MGIRERHRKGNRTDQNLVFFSFFVYFSVCCCLTALLLGSFTTETPIKSHKALLYVYICKGKDILGQDVRVLGG
jgi:hypothetical protein